MAPDSRLPTGAQSRSELVATFLSVLELCGSGSLEIYLDGEEVQLRLVS